MARNDGLRDYQQEMKLRLFEEWELHRSVMVQMPTGTGKTHLLAAVVKEFLCGGGVEKPLNFDPFGHARFAHLFVLYD